MGVRFCQNITVVDDTVFEPVLKFSLLLIPFNTGFEQVVYLNMTTIVIIDNDGCNCSTNATTIVIIDNGGCNCSTNANCTMNTPPPETVCDNTVSEGSFIAAHVILLIIVCVLICIITVLALLLCHKHHKDSERK